MRAAGVRPMPVVADQQVQLQRRSGKRKEMVARPAVGAAWAGSMGARDSIWRRAEYSGGGALDRVSQLGTGADSFQCQPPRFWRRSEGRAWALKVARRKGSATVEYRGRHMRRSTDKRNTYEANCDCTHTRANWVQ